MKHAQIRLLADELTQIGKNYKGFTCIEEKMTEALIQALNADLAERRELAAWLDSGALPPSDKLSAIAAKLRE